MKRHKVYSSKSRIAALVPAVLLLVSLLASCAQNTLTAENSVRLTDMAGREVSVPEDPGSICVLDAFAAPVVVMLGYGDRMPTTVNAVRRDLLLQSICPELKNSVVVKSGGAINAETILEYKTDLIIVGEDTYGDADERAKLETMGIPYIVISYADMEGQMEAVKLLGKALREEELAGEYAAYYQKCIDLVSGGAALVPEEEIKTLYHSVNEATRTDYEGSLCADWIALTRVENVSLDGKLDLQGDKAYATLEQIYEWDPDIVICNESGVADYILTDSKWQGLRAVIDGEVYQIPIGISRWGHPTSVETPLAILWLAELLYPERFDIDIASEMTDFYKTFFDYSLSDGEAEQILSGYGIRTEKAA